MRAILWFCFGFCFFFPFVWKWGKYCLTQTPTRPLWEVTVEWLFGGKVPAGTTLATISFALVLGAVYIDHLDFPGLNTVRVWPQHWTIACLLGSIAEFGASWAIKRILLLIFPGAPDPPDLPKD